MRSPKPKIRGERADKKAIAKLRYKVRRKIPDPLLHKPEGNSKLNDEHPRTLRWVFHSRRLRAKIQKLHDEQLKIG
jgi:hypothetical protein